MARRKESAPSSKITSKGQITLPLEIRRRLGVRPGDRVEFASRGKRITVQASESQARTPDAFDRYSGILGPFPGGVAGINAWLRDLRDPDAESKQR